MFVRKKRNKSGSTSVLIVEKRAGKYVVLKRLGYSKDENEIKYLVEEAKHLIADLKEQELLNFGNSQKDENILNFLKYNKSLKIKVVGPELLLGKIFDSIGFNVIEDKLFRHMVLSRLVQPLSKLKTVDYLRRYQGIRLSVQSLYDSLDRLDKLYKEKVEQIAFEHSKKILKTISVVFYDMTTVYFEAEDEDDLRVVGFSKDGKFQKPQIMLGLLVGEYGYPIAYEVFKGNTFEGHTLIPVIKDFQAKYGFKQAIVIVDAGLLNKSNLQNLAELRYEFIIAARLSSETNLIKKEILKKSKAMKNGDSFELKKTANIRLIVSYSDKRAKKDKHNRDKGLKRLKKRLSSGKLTKEHINKRGYNKFLLLTGKIKIEIDKEKVLQDQLWDGLKAYLSNTSLSAKEIIQNYNHLWQIERAFRISKTDLRIRPIFHRKERRIRSHICISFVAYTIYKELERLLKKSNIDLSAQKAIEISKTIYEMSFVLPNSRKKEKVLVNLTDEQKLVLRVSHP